jgi:hypothetical protein
VLVRKQTAIKDLQRYAGLLVSRETFATKSALFGHVAMSDLSPLSAPKATLGSRRDEAVN